ASALGRAAPSPVASRPEDVAKCTTLSAPLSARTLAGVLTTNRPTMPRTSSRVPAATLIGRASDSPRMAPTARASAITRCSAASGTLAPSTPAMSGPSRGSAGASAATRPQAPITAKSAAPTVAAIRFGVIGGSVVGARFDAELAARGVVERDDLATQLGALAELLRPRQVQLGLLTRDGVAPGSSAVVEVDHARGFRIATREGAHDEQVVVDVVVVHVVQHGLDDLRGEYGHGFTLIHHFRKTSVEMVGWTNTVSHTGTARAGVTSCEQAAPRPPESSRAGSSAG